MDGATPNDFPVKMKFREGSVVRDGVAQPLRDSRTNKPYFFISECGRYTVTIPLTGVDKYRAWYKATDKATPIGIQFDSALAAKTACEAHAHGISFKTP